jgi:hypothetical protein
MLYLHVASEGRIGAESRVETGDLIGRPSCEGGVSTATHLHIARRFNGEWIPADCQRCAPTDVRPRFEMSGWVTHGLSGQVYQGYMEKDQETRIAEQGRSSPENHVSVDDNESG